MSVDYAVIANDVSPTRGLVSSAKAPKWTTYPHVGLETEARVYRTSETYESYGACIASLFEWHTETLNAWTMIAHGVIELGLFAFLVHDRSLRGGDLALFLAHAIVVVSHSVFATGYHLFMPMSKGEHLFWRRLDGYGAYASFTTSAALLNYYAFPSGVFVGLLVVSLFVTLAAWANISGWTHESYFATHRHREWLFMSIAAIPQTVALVYVIVSDAIAEEAATGAVLAGSVLFFQALGAWVYVNKVPESLGAGFESPMSHFLMHACILVNDPAILFLAGELLDRRKR